MSVRHSEATAFGCLFCDAIFSIIAHRHVAKNVARGPLVLHFAVVVLAKYSNQIAYPCSARWYVHCSTSLTPRDPCHHRLAIHSTSDICLSSRTPLHQPPPPRRSFKLAFPLCHWCSSELLLNTFTGALVPEPSFLSTLPRHHFLPYFVVYFG